jgi:hypothetical protein
MPHVSCSAPSGPKRFSVKGKVSLYRKPFCFGEYCSAYWVKKHVEKIIALSLKTLILLKVCKKKYVA